MRALQLAIARLSLTAMPAASAAAPAPSPKHVAPEFAEPDQTLAQQYQQQQQYEQQQQQQYERQQRYQQHQQRLQEQQQEAWAARAAAPAAALLQQSSGTGRRPQQTPPMGPSPAAPASRARAGDGASSSSSSSSAAAAAASGQTAPEAAGAGAGAANTADDAPTLTSLSSPPAPAAEPPLPKAEPVPRNPLDAYLYPATATCAHPTGSAAASTAATAQGLEGPLVASSFSTPHTLGPYYSAGDGHTARYSDRFAEDAAATARVMGARGGAVSVIPTLPGLCPVDSAVNDNMRGMFRSHRLVYPDYMYRESAQIARQHDLPILDSVDPRGEPYA